MKAAGVSPIAAGARRALLVSCLVALLFPPVILALTGAEDDGAAASYVLILVALVPLTGWLLYGAMTSGRARHVIVLAVLYGVLSFLYIQGLDDPSWKKPDPQADAFAIASGILHALVAICSGTVLLTRVSVPTPETTSTADRTKTR